MDINLSYSRVSCYRECPYKHHLRYVQGIQTKQVARPLQFGKDFHKLLEYRWEKNLVAGTLMRIEEEFSKMPESWQNDLGTNYPSDIENIFNDYTKVYASWFNEEEFFKHARQEVAFSIPLAVYNGNNVSFVGVIDELLPLETSCLVEHKTFSQKPNPIFMTMNTQIALYAKAYKHMFKKPLKTVLWDYIKSTPATEPALLKSGGLSAAATKTVTPMSYLRACERHSIASNPNQYDQYKNNIEEFFFRRKIDVNQSIVKAVWQGFKRTILDILKNGNENTTQYITQSCGWCEYKDICMVAFSGGETADIIAEKYEKRSHE